MKSKQVTRSDIARWNQQAASEAEIRARIGGLEALLYGTKQSSLTRYERSKLRFDLSDLREDLARLLEIEGFSVDSSMSIAESEEEGHE